MSDAGREHAAPRALAAAALVTGIACGGEPPNGSLTAVSWGGAYARAVTKAHYEPFEAATGITLGREDYNGGLAEIPAPRWTPETSTGTWWTWRRSTRCGVATRDFWN